MAELSTLEYIATPRVKLYVTILPFFFFSKKCFRHPCVRLLIEAPVFLFSRSHDNFDKREPAIFDYTIISLYWKSPNRMPTKRVFINNQSLKYALKHTHTHSLQFITQYHSKYPKHNITKHDRNGILHWWCCCCCCCFVAFMKMHGKYETRDFTLCV